MLHELTSPDDEDVDAPQEEDVEEHEEQRRRRHPDEPPPQPAQHDSREEHQAYAARDQSSIRKTALKKNRGAAGRKARGGASEHRPAMGSMARSEREGKSRGTMATASCEKSTRPHDASADHSTSHGDDADLRRRWSPVASLLIAASYLLLRRQRPVGPRTIKAAARGGDPAGLLLGTADLGGVREMGAGAGEGIGGDARRISVDAGGGRAAAFRRTCAARGSKSGNSRRRNGLRSGKR
jgi:hypothetical protein